MRRHLERMTDRLPVHYDDEALSTNSTTSPSHHKDSAASGVRLNSIISGHHNHNHSRHESPLHEVEPLTASYRKQQQHYRHHQQSQHYPDPPPLPPDMANVGAAAAAAASSRHGSEA